MRAIRYLAAAVAVAISGAAAQASPVNLVQDGDFSQASGVGQIGNVAILPGWTVANGNGSFDFVIDSNADSNGFASSNSPPNITIWGPNSGTKWPDSNPANPGSYPPGEANGWAGLPSGYTYAVGIDGGYLASPLTQQISGLQTGHTYQLSFDYSFGQFYAYSGPTTQSVTASLGYDSYTTPTYSLPSHGFSGWTTATTTFTATAASELLSFVGTGSPAVPPFEMFTGVSLTDTTPAVPEPATWAMMGLGFAGLGFAGFRSARRKAAAA